MTSKHETRSNSIKDIHREDLAMITLQGNLTEYDKVESIIITISILPIHTNGSGISIRLRIIFELIFASFDRFVTSKTYNK